MTVDAADRHGIWVGVCGELASDPLGACILTGLGVRELSMSTRAIPRVKAEVRTLTMTQAKSLANAALAAESSEAVRQLTVEEHDNV
jgi:phosphocarrier protein FPr